MNVQTMSFIGGPDCSKRKLIAFRIRSIPNPPNYFSPKGIFASLAALMFNCVNRDDISYEWRLKLWLFVAYVVSFVSLAGAVGLLVQDALTGPSAWTGVAGVLQCVFVYNQGHEKRIRK